MIEAAQPRGWAPWHAIKPGTDVTFCGRNVIAWRRNIGHEWDDRMESERCRRCHNLVLRWDLR